MSSNRARYFQMMNRARQAKGQTGAQGQTTTTSPKPSQKSISNYFLPKAAMPVEVTSNFDESSPKPESPTSIIARKKTCERTIQALNSFAAKPREDYRPEPGVESVAQNSLKTDTSNGQEGKPLIDKVLCGTKRGLEAQPSRKEEPQTTKIAKQDEEIDVGQTSKKTKLKKPTPLEEQVIVFKSKHLGMVLMVECGYRYRFFGEDAYTASKILDIMAHKDDDAVFATASVPTINGANSYIRKLVSAGHKVGIVSQVETAAEKKANDSAKSSIFERRLTAVYTAATLIGDDIKFDHVDNDSPTGCRQTILSVVGEKLAPKICLVSVEPMAGQVTYEELGANMLEQRLALIQPLEIIIPDESCGALSLKCRETILRYQQERNSFASIPIRLEEMSKSRIGVKEFESALYQVNENSKTDDQISETASFPKKCGESVFCYQQERSSQSSNSVANGGETEEGVVKLRQLWPSFSLSMSRCFGMLYKYLAEFGIQQSLLLSPTISNFTSSKRDRVMHLPALTVRNLDIFESPTTRSARGSVFQALNLTQTRFGARLFQEWLAAPLTNLEEINMRLDVVEFFSSRFKTDIGNFRGIISGLPDLNVTLMAGLNKKIRPSDFAKMVHSLHRVSETLTRLSQNTTEEQLKERPELLSRIMNFVSKTFVQISDLVESVDLESASKNNYETIFSKLSNYPCVVAKKLEIEQLCSKLDSHKSDICRKLGLFSFSFTSVSGLDYLVEVSPPNRKVPVDWTRVNATKTSVRYRTPVINETLPKLTFARECLNRECQRAWSSFLESKVDIFRSFLVGLRGLSQLDCLLSLSDVARRNNFCRPIFNRKGRQISIEDGRNIIVEQSLKAGSQYVANDVTVGEDGRAILLTGPNMGGKSCYLRQVAMIALMAQIGSFVPALSATLPIFDAIYLRIGARDNQWAGKSTLAVELDEAGLILRQATSKSLVLLDELGRGTSTFDGVAIASAVLKHLVTRISCTTIFVTHYRKLTEELDLVHNYHMGYQTGQDSDDVEREVVFLYKLTKGPTESSFGLNVARMAGIPDSILQMATNLAEKLELTMSS